MIGEKESSESFPVPPGEGNEEIDAILGDVIADFDAQTFEVPLKEEALAVPQNNTEQGEGGTERLKKLQETYLSYNQDLEEKNIIGSAAIMAYMDWTEEAQRELKRNSNNEELVSYIPKRLARKIETIPEQNSPAESSILGQSKTEEQVDPSIEVVRKRLERIEQRILSLNENRPEYLEERLALEKKRLAIEQEGSSLPVQVENPTKDLLHKADELFPEVQKLLEKESFNFIAPVMSPMEEEEKRLKKADLAVQLEEKISTQTADQEGVEQKKGVEREATDEQLLEAVEKRDTFIQVLKNTSKEAWFASPSGSRDFVNKYVMEIAGLLGNKRLVDIDMNDVQTARLFLFRGAPQEILGDPENLKEDPPHPAFRYVESFYNFQNDQGHSGNPVKEALSFPNISQTTPEKVMVV